MDLDLFFKAVKDHHRLFGNSIPLIASENITSLSVKKCLLGDFGHRYAEGKVGDRYYQGCQFIDVIEDLAIKLTKELFEAEHVNVQPISGLTANLATFFALAAPGDKIMSLSIPCGGHVSHDKYSAAGVRGLRVIYYPFDVESMNIDVEKTKNIALKEKPKLMVLGGSLFLFPHPCKEIAEIAAEIKAKVIYDASHVLGLIAGKKFQDPVKEGADAIPSSTHKTFFGPQRGIIMSKAEIAKKIDNAVFPGIVSNHHLHTLAAYVVAAFEMRKFGREYALQVVKNAKKLAEHLCKLGFKVLGEDLGFTESHQVAVDVREFGGGDKVAKKLEKVNIILNKNLLPWDKVEDARNPSGIRIGVQEITRLGMKEDEMEVIAKLIWNTITEKKSESKIRQEVIEFRKEFNTVKYSFDESPAYFDPFEDLVTTIK